MNRAFTRSGPTATHETYRRIGRELGVEFDTRGEDAARSS